MKKRKQTVDMFEYELDDMETEELPPKKKPKKTLRIVLIAVLAAALLAGAALGAFVWHKDSLGAVGRASGDSYVFSYSDVPAYADEIPYAVLNDNQPVFRQKEITTKSFERYARLDRLGRCGTAFACLGPETLPEEERESIASVQPTGWENNDYGDLIDGGWLYNRCHLIAFCLSGENDNERNLVTGTRYMNIEGMWWFEQMALVYIQQTGNHVLYRVTPVFVGKELVCRGVHMEALSVEDNGEGVCWNVFCYNVQPGVVIDYATGENHAA